jgi:AcrR family transcriptional regulator
MAPNQAGSEKKTVQSRERKRPAQSRALVRDALVAAAERTMERQGLQGLRARALADEVGCAVGAIYNVVEDLDDLILAVNARTLAALETKLATAVGRQEEAPPELALRQGETPAPWTLPSRPRVDGSHESSLQGPELPVLGSQGLEPLQSPGRTSQEHDHAIGRLVRLALAYLDYASTSTLRWRALFDHRLPQGRPLPDWYQQDQQRLFDYVEEQLRDLQPDSSRERRGLLARSLFSAVHGIVVLGLEERLQAIPLHALREQLTFMVSTIGRGMTAAP